MPTVFSRVCIFSSTGKPDLTTTCEQWPPVNNSQFEPSTTSINLSFIRHLCQTAAFSRPQGWPLYTGLTVFYIFLRLQSNLPTYLCTQTSCYYCRCQWQRTNLGFWINPLLAPVQSSSFRRVSRMWASSLFVPTVNPECPKWRNASLR
jgi:hypothetical protein